MNIFQQITDYVKRQYSTFDMKNNWIGSINGFGSLNCIYQSIVLPSDTWKLGHNIMVKLPPLISPAFTRIKGIVNSYYCSFASVWNYWNSFISDKPEDVFLSRSLTKSYKGKFVEPCVRMSAIAIICKIARGQFDTLASSSDKFTTTYTSGNPSVLKVKFRTTYNTGLSNNYPSATAVTWSYAAGTGFRSVSLTPNTSVISSSSEFNYDESSALEFSFNDYAGGSGTVPQQLGFLNYTSYFIWCCQQVERNLSNHGVPTDLIASSRLSTYSEDYFNLLPSIAESSIWQNFYRDEQNQSPEFDYREVNGAMVSPTEFYGGSDGSMPYGWKLRLLGIPPNISTGSDYWFDVSTAERCFSVLTGFLLEESVRRFVSLRPSATDINILPKYYNGLLTLKYRNFEKDYFTSACVDPNFGGISVQVPNTIDALRTASKLEEFLEVSASARDFYNFMKHIWGTNPESTRYSKPLLLGTQVIPIQIGEQLQTSQTTVGANGSPLGERGGVADGYGNSGTINHYFNEHGIVVSYLSFVLDAQYMQGMPHEFNHHLQLDYPFPQFANLGAESIPTKEIYYGDASAFRSLDFISGDNNAVKNNTSFLTRSQVDSPRTDTPSGMGGSEVGIGLDTFIGQDPGNANIAAVMNTVYDDNLPPTVFGYTPRYSRWKFKLDVVAGQMRDDLEFWHTFRHFSSIPYISNAFVSYMNAGYLSDLNRIFAVTNDNSDKFVVDCFNNGSVRRALPLVPQTTMD